MKTDPFRFTNSITLQDGVTYVSEEYFFKMMRHELLCGIVGGFLMGLAVAWIITRFL